MSLFDVIVLAIALAMDCFTISVVSGVILKRIEWRTVIRMSFLFGLFQAGMPFIGWFFAEFFSHYIESYDHWVAFLLLLFLGCKMIHDSFEKDETKHFNPRKLKTQIELAIATSIDALAVGISFACMQYNSIYDMALPLFIIGIVSFIFAVAGNILGVKFGNTITRRLKPEIFGGIILILIGLKILITHLTS